MIEWMNDEFGLLLDQRSRLSSWKIPVWMSLQLLRTLVCMGVANCLYHCSLSRSVRFIHKHLDISRWYSVQKNLITASGPISAASVVLVSRSRPTETRIRQIVCGLRRPFLSSSTRLGTRRVPRSELSVKDFLFLL